MERLGKPRHRRGPEAERVGSKRIKSRCIIYGDVAGSFDSASLR
jgi:hypothetical protein